MVWRPNPPPFRGFKKKVFTKDIKVSGFIYQIGESEILRKPCKEVPLDKVTSKETKAKIKYLKDCLIKYRKITGFGRGITAVQVGIPERFSVIYKGQTIKNIKNKKSVTYDDVEVIINPKVTAKSKKLLRYPESCMSLSPVIVPTIRPSWIEFDYFDEEGKLEHWVRKDRNQVDRMMNRVFQHEIDHMEGIINIDKIKSPKEVILWSNPDFYSSAKFEEV